MQLDLTNEKRETKKHEMGSSWSWSFKLFSSVYWINYKLSELFCRFSLNFFVFFFFPFVGSIFCNEENFQMLKYLRLPFLTLLIQWLSISSSELLVQVSRWVNLNRFNQIFIHHWKLLVAGHDECQSRKPSLFFMSAFFILIKCCAIKHPRLIIMKLENVTIS